MASLTNYLSRRGEILILVLLVLLSVCLMLLSSGNKETLARSLNDAAVTPMQSVLTSGDQYVGLRDENRDLRTKLAESSVRIAALREAELENERLRAMLEIRGTSANRLVAARIVAGEAARTGRELKIDKGSQDGLRPDLGVVTPAGLVGKISRVGPRSAFVRPLLARNCRVSARLVRSRTEGIVEWNGGGTLELRFLPYRADAQPGDAVVTSGLGGVFPRGIPLGTVSRVATDERDGATIVELEPAVHLAGVEEVYVVQGDAPFDSELPGARAPESPGE